MRNLKTLGLALVAVFAMSAIAASAAQAEFTIGAGAAKVTASQKTTNKFIIPGVGEVECPTGTGEGAVAEGTFEAIEFTPNYGGTNACTAFGQPAEVLVTNCTFLVTTTREVHVCPGTEPPARHIVITATSGGVSICTITFGAQTVTVSSFTNEGTGNAMDITINTAVTGIKYTTLESSGGKCGSTGTFTNGEYKGKITLKADDKNNNQVSLTHSRF